MSIKSILGLLTFLILCVSCSQSNEQLLDKAYNFCKQKKYDKAIEIYTKVIKSNYKIQSAYYNRGIAYLETQKYDKAFWDFNRVMGLQTHGGYIITFNQDGPLANEETRTQVPYNDALYQRAQAEYYMDSLKSSFIDFQTLVNSNYEEKSNCMLWQGSIYIRSGKTDKACTYFEKARQSALSDEDKSDADEMIKTYCGEINNNR
jgi:tetratricopeptide (TPR) repeat protein